MIKSGREPSVSPDVYREGLSRVETNAERCLAFLADMAEDNPKAVAVFVLSSARRQTTAQISAKTGVSIRTVDRILAYCRKRKRAAMRA